MVSRHWTPGAWRCRPAWRPCTPGRPHREAGNRRSRFLALSSAQRVSEVTRYGQRFEPRDGWATRQLIDSAAANGRERSSVSRPQRPRRLRGPAPATIRRSAANQPAPLPGANSYHCTRTGCERCDRRSRWLTGAQDTRHNDVVFRRVLIAALLCLPLWATDRLCARESDDFAAASFDVPVSQTTLAVPTARIMCPARCMKSAPPSPNRPGDRSSTTRASWPLRVPTRSSRYAVRMYQLLVVRTTRPTICTTFLF